MRVSRSSLDAGIGSSGDQETTYENPVVRLTTEARSESRIHSSVSALLCPSDEIRLDHLARETEK